MSKTLKDKYVKKGRIFVDMKSTPHSYEKIPDIEEADKVHPLDPPHVRAELEDEHIMKEEGLSHHKTEEQILDEAQALEDADRDPRNRRLNQERVYEILLRVSINLMGSYLDRGEKTVPIYHLMFPKDDINEYYLHEGNPPAKQDLPKHMHGVKTIIDIGQIPDDVAEEFSTRKAMHTMKARMKRRNKSQSEVLWVPPSVGDFH